MEVIPVLNNESIGKNLKDAREEKAMKQKVLAERINIAPQTISAYEKGAKCPTLENIVAIADCLGVSVDSLLGRARPEEEGSSSAPTLGDCGRLVDILRRSNMISVSSSAIYSPEEIEVTRSVITVFDQKLSDFIRDYDKMYSLLLDGTIYESLFEQWIKGRLLGLDRIGLPTFEDPYNEGELPF